MNVRGSTVHLKLKVETMEMSIGGWMGKQNVVYLYNKLLFCH